MRSKVFLLTTVSVLALMGALGAAHGADLAVRPVAKAPPPPVVVEAPFSWVGFYAGVQGGFGRLDHEQTTTQATGVCATANNVSHCEFKPNGGVFGGFAGYNLQSGNVVYGIEVDGSWVGLKHTESFDTTTGVTDPVIVRGQVNWLATARGRLGVAFSPTLLYVTGALPLAASIRVGRTQALRPQLSTTRRRRPDGSPALASITRLVNRGLFAPSSSITILARTAGSAMSVAPMQRNSATR